MKIYIQNLNPLFLYPNNVDKFIIDSYTKEYIYTQNNIFKIHFGEIKKIDIVDYPITKKKLDNYTLLIDKSESKIGKSVYQIPNKFFIKKLFVKEYSFDKLSDIKLIIEWLNDYNGEKIHDIYFILKDNNYCSNITFSYFIKNYIVTFLSLLRNIQ